MKKKFLVFALCACSAHIEAGISVNSRTTQIYNAAPGEQLRSVVVLSNSSDKLEEANVYCSDYSFASDGACRFDPPGSHPKSNCTWIKLAQSLVTVPPKSTVEFPVTITVPNTPTLEGTYWGVVFVEPVTAPLPLPSEEKLYQTVKSNVRYGIQFVTEIGKTGKFGVKVLKSQVVEDKEKKYFVVDVENTGSRFVQLKPSLDVFTKQGRKVREVASAKKLVYPTCSTNFGFDVTDVEAGDYLGFLLLDHSEEAIFGGQYPFVIEAKKEVEKKNDET